MIYCLVWPNEELLTLNILNTYSESTIPYLHSVKSWPYKIEATKKKNMNYWPSFYQLRKSLLKFVIESVKKNTALKVDIANGTTTKATFCLHFEVTPILSTILPETFVKRQQMNNNFWSQLICFTNKFHLHKAHKVTSKCAQVLIKSLGMSMQNKPSI